MIELAHRQHGSPSFRPSSSSSPFSSRNKPDLAPLPIRHLKAPASPLVNNFTSSSFAEDREDGSTGVQKQSANGSQTAKELGSSGGSSSSSSNGTRNFTKAGGGNLSQLSTSTSMLQHNPLMHRIRKGQKQEDIQPPLPSTLPPVQTIDSPFQLQEYLALAIRLDPHNVERIVSLPQPFDGNTSEKGKGRDGEASAFSSMDEEAQPVDTDVWIYEQLRRIVLDFSTPWLTLLQKDCDKKLKPKSCEAMNADDWMYLCASHGEEKQCCAIDYIIHTLDGTTALLNSQRHFPSRTFIPTTSLRHFGSISRRLSRIFVHAFEHHRDVFEACEAETSLYARFFALVQTFDLIAIDSLPRLGETEDRESSNQSSDTSPATQGDAVPAAPTVSQSSTSLDGGREPDSHRLSGKRQLFQANVPTLQDEEENDDAEEVEGGEGGGKEASYTDILTNPEASASGVTDDDERVGGKPEEESSEKGGQDKTLNLARENGQEEVPQDVKDEEEDDE
ncbi:hypothetical protein CBS101457_000688 [Exobasidium rhododendri]|nr:hypothetical protein CBS101457_000688 [Exobasidium rhododendri]